MLAGTSSDGSVGCSAYINEGPIIQFLQWARSMAMHHMWVQGCGELGAYQHQYDLSLPYVVAIVAVAQHSDE